MSLGLQDRWPAPAYSDDQIPERWKAAYGQVKVLAEKYPAKEASLAAKPDFAYVLLVGVHRPGRRQPR
ncbi:MAG: hypothetical protein R2719_11155 [Micropruina sp.]